MHKAIFDGLKKVVGKGEHMAPIKSIKTKVKFDTKGKSEVDDKKEKLAKKIK